MMTEIFNTYMVIGMRQRGQRTKKQKKKISKQTITQYVLKNVVKYKLKKKFLNLKIQINSFV